MENKRQSLFIYLKTRYKFRIIAAIHYNRRRIYIRHVLTHAEYDKGKWKEE